MNRAQANLVKFSSKYNEFRAAGQFTDVTIKCEGETFKCHRITLAAASPYFRAMFTHQDFEEGKRDATVSLEIDAQTFQQVLEFIYTGEVALNCDNLYSLIKAGDYFGIQGIDELCTRFVAQNRIYLGETIFEILAFVSITGKDTLTHLLSAEIAIHLNTLSRSLKFLKMSFNDLCALFDQLLIINKNIQCSAVIRWIEHCAEERMQYYNQIFERYGLRNMSMLYYHFLASNLYNPAAVVLNCNKNLEIPCKSVPRVGSLNVFVKNIIEENSVSIVSINSFFECSVAPRKLNWIRENKDQCIRSAAVDNFYLYSLQYNCGNEETAEQSFSLSTSINIHSAQNLTSPPLIFRGVCMCALSGCIYVYHRTLDSPIIRTSSSCSVSFNNEEISHGIYLYQCELDRWYPVSAMPKFVADASMVTCNNCLYLVGGRQPHSLDKWTCKQFQAYDSRSGIWQELPALPAYHVEGDCCVLDDKIYACGGSRDVGDIVQRYDLTAGRWERMAFMKRPHYKHRVVSFLGEIWAMGNSLKNDNIACTAIEIYDPKQNLWLSSNVLTKAIADFPSYQTTNYVLDSIVL